MTIKWSQNILHTSHKMRKDKKVHIYTFDYKYYIKNEKGKISVYRDIKVNSSIQKNGDDYFLFIKWIDNLGKKDIGNKSNIKIKKPEILAILNSEKSN